MRVDVIGGMVSAVAIAFASSWSPRLDAASRGHHRRSPRRSKRPTRSDRSPAISPGSCSRSASSVSGFSRCRCSPVRARTRSPRRSRGTKDSRARSDRHAASTVVLARIDARRRRGRLRRTRSDSGPLLRRDPQRASSAPTHRPHADPGPRPPPCGSYTSKRLSTVLLTVAVGVSVALPLCYLLAS